jgi:hypothetical protein
MKFEKVDQSFTVPHPWDQMWRRAIIADQRGIRGRLSWVLHAHKDVGRMFREFNTAYNAICEIANGNVADPIKEAEDTKTTLTLVGAGHGIADADYKWCDTIKWLIWGWPNEDR